MSLTVPSLRALRRDEDTTDIRIVLDDGTSILAHRAILAMSSPVLRRALFGPMKLPIDQPLPLPGKDAAAVQGLLAYCYGEPLVIQDEVPAIPLLQLADEYGIDGLKTLCEGWFKDHLESFDDSSLTDLVLWAQRYECSALLKHLQEVLPKRLRAHLNAGEVEAARMLATSHTSFAPQLADSMREFDSGTLKVHHRDTLTLKTLLVQRGADPDAVLDLSHYIVNGTAAEVWVCLEAGAKPRGLNMISYHGTKAMNFDKGYLEKARLLLERGAEFERGSIGSACDDGQTPLHMVARCCRFEGKRYREALRRERLNADDGKETPALDLAKLFAEFGAPLDARDGEGKLYWEETRWDESWREGMRPSEVKKAVEEAAAKGKGSLHSPPAPTAAEQQPRTKAEGKKRQRCAR